MTCTYVVTKIAITIHLGGTFPMYLDGTESVSSVSEGEEGGVELINYI